MEAATCALVLTHHEGIDHRAEDGLQQQQHGAHRTLVGDDAVAIADGGFRLDGEEEGRDKAVDVVDTRRPVCVTQMVQIAPCRKQTQWEGACKLMRREGKDFTFNKTRLSTAAAVPTHELLWL